MHSGWHLEIWVKVYAQYYSHATLFILVLFTEILVIAPTMSADIIHNIHTIQTNHIHYLYRRQFLLIL